MGKDLQKTTKENKQIEPAGEQESQPAARKKDFYSEITFEKLFEKATKLKLTETEKNKLYQDFDDKNVEILPTGIIYLPHIQIRRRFNEIFGLEWAMVPLGKPSIEANTVVWGFALIIKGVYIDIAYGDTKYYENNPMMTYSDCIEGAKSDCLRRLGKSIGIGTKLWAPEYIRKWKERYAVKIFDNNTKKITWRKLAPGEEKTPKGWLKTSADKEKPVETPSEKPEDEPETTPKKGDYSDAVKAYVNTKKFKDWCKENAILTFKDVTFMLEVYHAEKEPADITLEDVKDWENNLNSMREDIEEVTPENGNRQRESKQGPEKPQIVNGNPEQGELSVDTK